MWRLIVSVVFLMACCASSIAAADEGYVEQGAWYGRAEPGAAPVCVVESGGYDPLTGTRDPLVSLRIDGGPAGNEPAELTVTVETTASLEALRRAALVLRVAGPQARSVRLMPAAILNRGNDRLLTLRAAGNVAQRRDATRRLIDAMRAGDTLSVQPGAAGPRATVPLAGFAKVYDAIDQACHDKQ